MPRDFCPGTHPDLELHDISAGRGANETRSHVGIVLVEGADVARALVVLYHLEKRREAVWSLLHNECMLQVEAGGSTCPTRQGEDDGAGGWA